MNLVLLGFNLCLLTGAFVWWLWKVMEKDRQAAIEAIVDRKPKPSRLGRSALGAFWELRFIALLITFGFWVSYRQLEKPKPEASYYGNPHWWAEVEGSSKPATTATSTTVEQWQHATLEAPDPVYVPPAKSGAQLPNPQLTPGVVDPKLTAAVLCGKRFRTGQIRNVDESTKRKVCQEYGVRLSDCNGRTLEIDHLISLELGGSNDMRNLWAQPYNPRPAAHEKDLVEDWLHRQVCSGKVSLPEAQREIVDDWYGIYLRMPKAHPAHRGR